jgi:hypothetical protein
VIRRAQPDHLKPSSGWFSERISKKVGMPDHITHECAGRADLAAVQRVASQGRYTVGPDGVGVDPA